ncbi:MAG TPA: UDP-N-acetylmuramoyl-L-alanyl-D-glutamate--2,6-diaminopimelate ligase [Candidatus Polarisedimenticolaceae bacterium]|nr:UDP-N-acetylmuramoyl-L-alanyl-D-glutamate--2,6-diaminopimelate ligase [Candidatus Polarisedimenticolaceae bacterium]
MTPRGTRLGQLLQLAGVRPLAPVGLDPEVRGITLDSRRVTRGDVFCAIRGLRTDGEAYVAEAVTRGAVAILAASPRPPSLDAAVAWVRVTEPRLAGARIAREHFGRPDAALTLVGVTGTNGKTTTVYLLEAIALAGERRAGRIGTVGYAHAGQERAATRTTPEATELYRLLAEMRDARVELVAMEVSSHALALYRVEGAHFAVAAFLNLGRDHFDFHEDATAYFEAKARLFDGLGSEQTAVLPADTPHGEQLRRRTRARVLSFGRTPAAQVRLLDERCELTGSSAKLETPWGSTQLRTHLPGRFNLDNVAAAAACALAAGLPLEAVARGVDALRVVPGRLERIEQGQPFTVFVDYAHTEAALENVLTGLRELTAGGRLLVVFGCGGERDPGKRPGMGRIAATGADLVFLTSDNPRGEDPERILDEIARGVAEVPGGPQRCRRLADRGEAIAAAVAAARAGDVLIIAGKGHEATQESGGTARAFDDRRVAASALGETRRA